MKKGLSAVYNLVFALFLFPVASRAQDNAPPGPPDKISQPYISWVSQYPVKKEKEKTSTFRRICEFLVGKGKENTLVRPVGILASGPSDFWVLDQGKQTIFDVEKNKGIIPKPIRKKENYFTSLISVCALPNNGILFTDSRLNKIFRYSVEEQELEPVNDTLTLLQPTGIGWSPVTHEIWVVETGGHRITVLNDSGAVIRRIGSRGQDEGQFNFPTSICIDKEGTAYVVDAMNFRIQIFNKDGQFVSVFGEAGDMSGTLARPKGIAVDTYGNIYIADALFHVVQIFDKAGNFLYSFGKQGREKEEFWMPAGLFIDSNNYIYVADSYNSRVQVFQLINGG